MKLFTEQNEQLTHKELVNIAANWITGQHIGNREFMCRYAVKELCTASYAVFDVYGLGFNHTTMIEVKTSHADFLRDKKKWYRRHSKWDKRINVADYNIYFCPKNIIKSEELPDNWGLLWYYQNNKQVKIIKSPIQFDRDVIELVYERKIVKSIIRRFIQPKGGVIEIPKQEPKQELKQNNWLKFLEK
jgi:hypothetical protein